MSILPDHTSGGTPVAANSPDISACSLCDGSGRACDACMEPWQDCRGACGTVFSAAARCSNCDGTGVEPADLQAFRRGEGNR